VRWLAVALAAVLLGFPATAAAAPGPDGHPEWWFDAWHVSQLWAEGVRGQGVTIGVIDTGVQASLPELAANVLPGKDFGQSGGDGRVDRDMAAFGHGTAMASLMIARAGQFDILGLAPDARVLPVAVPITGTTDDAGGAANGDLVDAIRWAADHGAKIINMSLGAPRDPDGSGHRSCPRDEQDAVDYALNKGAIVVAAAGNSGADGSPIEEPSVCLGVIAVGAQDESGAVPAFSSRHPYLTVSAPGVDVPTLSREAGQAFFGDGTSEATALTSAGLALVWSKYPHLSARQVVGRLLATLDNHRSTRDTASGFGGVDIGRAVDASVPIDAPNPVYDAVEPFLARDRELRSVPPSPPVTRTVRERAGGFVIAAPPGPLASGQGLAGLVAAVVGLVAVVALMVVGLPGPGRRRR
jgi:subtilisin family serine protease